MTYEHGDRSLTGFLSSRVYTHVTRVPFESIPRGKEEKKEKEILDWVPSEKVYKLVVLTPSV